MPPAIGEHVGEFSTSGVFRLVGGGDHSFQSTPDFMTLRFPSSRPCWPACGPGSKATPEIRSISNVS